MLSEPKRSKDADFELLAKSSKTLSGKLGYDETVNGDGEILPYSHKEEYGSGAKDQSIEQLKFIPMSQKVFDHFESAECASFMGLIPEINRAWVTIDNRLYLWNYMLPQDCEVYDGLTDIILSVSLSAPKPGMFLDNIKYLIILATSAEVVILALSWDQEKDSLKIIPTAYKMGIDNVMIVKVLGTQSGRMFLAGSDGNMYELEYGTQESPWSVAFGSEQVAKCRKINHSSGTWKMLNILPSFLRSNPGPVDSLIDLAVDEARNVLYTLSLGGNIGIFFLGGKVKNVVSPLILREFNVIRETQKFLETQKSSCNLPAINSFLDIKSLSIIGICVVPLTESRKSHLLVILNNGSRIYLQLVYTEKSPSSDLNSISGPRSTGFSCLDGQYTCPSEIRIMYVRHAPSAEQVRNAIPSGNVNGVAVNVIEPPALRFSKAKCSHGMFLAAVEKGGLKGGDHLLCIYANSADANTHTNTPSSSSSSSSSLVVADHHTENANALTVHSTTPSSSNTPGEILCVPAAATGLPAVVGRIHDIREGCSYIHNELASVLLSSYSLSATTNDVSDPYPSRGPFDPLNDALENVPGPGPAIACGGMAGRGLQKNNLRNAVTLGEHSLQCIPCPFPFLHRQVICLTNRGVHILQKVRPIDQLYRILTANDYNERTDVRNFFDLYGLMESACMCLGLACDFPASGGVEEHDKRMTSHTIVRERALRSIRLHGCVKQSAAPPSARAGEDRILSIAPAIQSKCLSSSVHDAFFLLTSRLLRGIWLCAIPSFSSEEIKTSCVWSPEVISALRNPLSLLLQALEKLYPVSLEEPVLVDTATKERTFAASFLQNGQKPTKAVKLSEVQTMVRYSREKMGTLEAKDVEAESLKGLRRLLVRCLHALSLIEILQVVEVLEHNKSNGDTISDLSIPNGVFHKSSFRTLVISARTHDLIRVVLTGKLKALCEGDADRIADRLSEECYTYFSSGDRCMYEAERTLHVIKVDTPPFTSSPQLTQQLSILFEMLKEAALYWVTLRDVICDKSALHTSNLSKYCTVLRTLGRRGREGIISLCSITYKNFQPPSPSTSRGTAQQQQHGQDREHYHSGSPFTVKECEAGKKACFSILLAQIEEVGFSRIPQSTDSIDGPLGRETEMEIEAEVATMTYSERAAAAARLMIDHSLFACDDAMFQSMLYNFLLVRAVDVLITLDPTQSVEDFLNKQDPDLLYRYFMHHRMFTRAAHHMDLLSQTPDDTHINTRMDSIEKAVHSASQAFPKGPLSEESFSQDIEREYLAELNGKRNLARQQQRAYVLLSEDLATLAKTPKITSTTAATGTTGTTAIQRGSKGEELDSLKTVTARLEVQLLTATELFNEICMPFKLWEICLILMHATNTRTDNPQLSAQLFRSILYRIIPDRAENPEGKFFLETKRIQSNIFIDERHQESSYSFESVSRWLPELSKQVVFIGSQIHGPSGDASFPLISLIEELEDISTSASSRSHDSQNQSENGTLDLLDSFPRGWTVSCAVKMGIRYGSIVGCLMQLLDRWSTRIPEKHTHLLSSICFAILEWKKCYLRPTDSGENIDGDEILSCLQSGWLNTWNGIIRSHATHLANGRISECSKKRLQIIAEGIREIKNFIDTMSWRK